MAKILVATDGSWVRDQVRIALLAPGTQLVEVTRGQDVRDTFARIDPDLVVLDLQIGNMGGIAACLHLRHEAGMERLPEVPVLMLLDRQADVFLAKRSGADGWVVKPLDAFTLRTAAAAILEGGEDTTAERELVGDVNPA